MYEIPSEIQCRDSNKSAIDVNNIRGVSVKASIAERNAIPSDKRRLGAICNIVGDSMYHYVGSDLTDNEWQNDLNWESLPNSSPGLIMLEANINHANTTLYDFFPAGYILEYMIVTNITANASSTPNFGTNGISYFSAPVNFEYASRTNVVFHNPAATGTDGVYYYYNFVKQILFSATCKDFIATATAWNNADYNIKFYLRKLL